jgi:hypothetical protein
MHSKFTIFFEVCGLCVVQQATIAIERRVKPLLVFEILDCHIAFAIDENLLCSP